MAESLIVYGHPASQPSRTVYWACLMHDLRFKLADPKGLELDTGDTNPRGQVPSMDDDGFYLAEASAIVCYLADKHDWQNLYPRELKTRARINQCLHMHHELVRLATYYLMLPYVLGPLGRSTRKPNPLSIFQAEFLMKSLAFDDPRVEGGEIVHTIAGFLEENYFNEQSPFVCNTETASVADLMCYGDLGQFQFTNLFDYRDYPKIQRWLDAMRGLPHHDTIHAYNIELGDIVTKPNTMERFGAASEVFYNAMRQTGLVS